MSRYIDADALIEKKWQAESEACFYALEDVVSVTDIEEAPSIDLADYVPKDFHDKTCEAMAKRHTEEIQRLMPKRGEWKKVKNVHAWDVSGVETWGVKRKCTNCDFRHTFIEDHGHYNFCPNCGADMKGADDE